MFDPDGYWTLAEAANLFAGWGARGEMPKNLGFIPDGEPSNVVDLPNDVTAAHVIGDRLASGSLQAWARDALCGFMFPIPPRCWRVEPSLHDAFKGGSVKMSEVGYPGLSVDIPVRIYIRQDEMLSCFGLGLRDRDPAEVIAIEQQQDVADTVPDQKTDSESYKRYKAAARRADYELFRHKPPQRPSQRDPSLLSGKSVSDLLNKWLIARKNEALGSVDETITGHDISSPTIPPDSPLPHSKPKSNGKNYKEADAPLVAEAIAGLTSKKFRTPWDAALALASRAAGTGNDSSKTIRLSNQIKPLWAKAPLN